MAVAVIAPPGVPEAPTTFGGAPGVVAGMTPADRADWGPAPMALTAVTRNPYVEQFVSPVTVKLVTLPGAATVRGAPGPSTRMSYRMIGVPPLLAGAVQFTIADALPRTGVPMVGAPGSPIGVTAADRADGALLPIAFTAMTR